MPSAKVLTGIGVIVVVAIVGFAILGGGPKTVVLTKSDDLDVCVTTDPASLWIYKNKLKYLFKRKKARWKVNPDQSMMYHWKIEYQQASLIDLTKMGTGDYLGPVKDIACTGPQHTKSKKAPSNTTDADLQWPYKIGVYECGGTNFICEVDPIIWIKD